MRKLTWLAVCAAAFISPLYAKDLYRARGADGSIIFSDKPIPGGQIIHVKDIPTISLPKPNKGGAVSYPIKSVSVQGGIARYSKLVIASPTNDSTLENQSGELNVELNLSPGLQAGHKYRLVLDGKKIDPPTVKNVFKLNNLDRGDHKIQGEVVDKDGLPVIASEIVTIHVHRPSIEPKEAQETPPPVVPSANEVSPTAEQPPQ